MTSLKSLQKDMLDFLANDKPSNIVNRIVSPQRLSIYKEGYTVRLFETLKRNYTQSLSYIGHKYFKKLCLFHIAEHPSQNYNLQHYGHNLKQSLSCLKGDISAEHYTNLELLIQMDWLSNLCFHNPHICNDIQNQLSALKSIETAKIQFQDHVQLMHSPIPIYQLWMNLLHKNSITPCKNKLEPEYFLFYRHDQQVMLKQLDALEHSIIHTLQQGTELSQCFKSLHEDTIHPEKITKFFSTWISLDIIANIQ